MCTAESRQFHFLDCHTFFFFQARDFIPVIEAQNSDESIQIKTENYDLEDNISNDYLDHTNDDDDDDKSDVKEEIKEPHSKVNLISRKLVKDNYVQNDFGDDYTDYIAGDDTFGEPSEDNDIREPQKTEDIISDHESEDEYIPLVKKHSTRSKRKSFSGLVGTPRKRSKTELLNQNVSIAVELEDQDVPADYENNSKRTAKGPCSKTLQRWKGRKGSTKEIQCYLCCELMGENHIMKHSNDKHEGIPVRINITYGPKQQYQCHVCKASLKGKIGTIYHICLNLLPRDQPNAVECEKCQKIFKSTIVLLAHLSSDHDTTRPFKCSDCEYDTTSGRLLYAHNKQVHKLSKLKTTEKEFKCQKCSHSTHTKLLLTKHVKCMHDKPVTTPITVNSRAIYKCDFCIKAFVNRQVWRNHLIKEHDQQKNPKGHYPCDQCIRVFDTSKGLLCHKTTKHNDITEERFPCDICGNIAVSRTLFNVHYRNEHMNEDQIAKVECKCEQCNVEFPTAFHLNVHLSSSCLDTPMKFQCGLCSQKDSTNCWHSSIALKKHLAEVHQKNREVCHICGVQIIGCIKRHMENVHDGEGHRCDRCGKKLATKHALKHHIMAIHEGIRPFECKDCNKRFVSEGELERHQQSKHIREVKYKCPHCSYFTYLYGVIPKHILEVHKRAKPHKCDYCNHEGFFYLRDKRKHYMLCHSEHDNMV